VKTVCEVPDRTEKVIQSEVPCVACGHNATRENERKTVMKCSNMIR